MNLFAGWLHEHSQPISVCRAFRRMSTEASILEYESCYLTPKGGVFSPDFLKGKQVKRQSVDE
jgi:hypothetical protein